MRSGWKARAISTAALAVRRRAHVETLLPEKGGDDLLDLDGVLDDERPLLLRRRLVRHPLTPSDPDLTNS